MLGLLLLLLLLMLLLLLQIGAMPFTKRVAVVASHATHKQTSWLVSEASQSLSALTPLVSEHNCYSVHFDSYQTQSLTPQIN